MEPCRGSDPGSNPGPGVSYLIQSSIIIDRAKYSFLHPFLKKIFLFLAFLKKITYFLSLDGLCSLDLPNLIKEFEEPL